MWFGTVTFEAYFVMTAYLTTFSFFHLNLNKKKKKKIVST